MVNFLLLIVLGRKIGTALCCAFFSWTENRFNLLCRFKLDRKLAKSLVVPFEATLKIGLILCRLKLDRKSAKSLVVPLEAGPKTG